jgi:protein SCO1
MKRRTVLMNLATSVAVIPATAFGGARQVPPGTASEQPDESCARPLRGPHADYFPNVVVSTHEGQKALFYDDLLRGKLVMINCMSVTSEATYPVTENLVKVQQLLGDRVGRDVFLYSLTLEPASDTPPVLQAFAKRYGVKPGWLFLTGEPALIDGLRGRLFAHGPGHDHTADPVQDCSRGLIRYGNEAIGLWGSVPARTEPEELVKRLSWVEARALPTGPSQRKGPPIRA